MAATEVPSSMIREHRFFESPLVTVARLDHPPDVPHDDPEVEISTQYSVIFIERGGFAVRHGGTTRNVGPQDIFVTVPGLVCQFDHGRSERAPDDVCLAVRFENDDHGVMADLGITQLDRLAPVIPLNNRRAYLRDRLLSTLTDTTTPMAIEAIAAELLVSALTIEAPRRLFKSDQ